MQECLKRLWDITRTSTQTVKESHETIIETSTDKGMEADDEII